MYMIANIDYLAQCNMTSAYPHGNDPGEVIPPTTAAEAALHAPPYNLTDDQLRQIRQFLIGTRIYTDNLTNAKAQAHIITEDALRIVSTIQAAEISTDVGYKPLGGGVHSMGFWILMPNGTQSPVRYTVTHTPGPNTHRYDAYALISLRLVEL